MLIQVTASGHPMGSRLPLLAEAALVERLAAPELVTPMTLNPFFSGIPWLIPGPVAGAPYYV